jgi:HD-GYP domain-containing protein (c-di-GMP phosphodiesterase class II)
MHASPWEGVSVLERYRVGLVNQDEGHELSGTCQSGFEPDAHALNVTRVAIAIAHDLAVGDGTLEALRIGGPVHDIGKIAIPRELLSKQGPLAPAELAEVRRHPVLGGELVWASPDLRIGFACVRHHHERWDGAGYPDGLGGMAITPEARILSVADAYDAIVTDRPYRRAASHEAALKEIARCAGTQFDGRIVDAFMRVMGRSA